MTREGYFLGVIDSCNSFKELTRRADYNDRGLFLSQDKPIKAIFDGNHWISVEKKRSIDVIDFLQKTPHSFQID